MIEILFCFVCFVVRAGLCDADQRIYHEQDVGSRRWMGSAIGIIIPIDEIIISDYT